MKRFCIATLFCCLLGFLSATTTIPSQLDSKPEIPVRSLVYALRFLNTHEYAYRDEAGRFASSKEIVTFLRAKGILNQSPIYLDSPGPYEWAITTSADGNHYHISLKPRFNPTTNTWSVDLPLSPTKQV